MRKLLLALIGVLFSLGPALAAVAVDATGTADTLTNNATAATFTNITVGSGSNRALVVLFEWGQGGTTAPTNVACTWDTAGGSPTNQAMTAITGTANSRSTTGPNRISYSVLFGLVAPTPGNKTLTCTWTTAGYVYLNAISFTGVAQAGGATSFPNGTNAVGITANPSVTVTSAVGQYVVGGGSNFASVSAINNTSLFIDNTGAQNNGFGNYATGAATVTLTATAAANIFAYSGTGVAAFVAPTGGLAGSLNMLGTGN